MSTLDFIKSMEAAGISSDKILLALKEHELLKKEATRQRVKKHRNNNKPVTNGHEQMLHAEKPLNNNKPVTNPALHEKNAIYTSLPSEVVSKKVSKITGSRFSLTSLPSDWKSFCQAKRPDLNPEETFDAFMDWWIAQPGSKGIKLDWFATWRTWIRNQKRLTGNYNAKPAEHRKANVITL